MVHKDLKLPVTELPDYCRRNGIHRLELFGSATRADFGPQSDVDLLVEFRPEARIGFVALSRMQRELSVLFGRSVDLVPRAGLKPVIASSVLKEAEPLYAE
jgi:predicted nucleotidyltransferase